MGSWQAGQVANVLMCQEVKWNSGSIGVEGFEIRGMEVRGYDRTAGGKAAEGKTARHESADDKSRFNTTTSDDAT